MLVGLAGALSGFNGSYTFESGAQYPDHVPFKMMRILLALPGVAMVPLAWGTASELRFSLWSRHIVTLMVLCGKSYILISLETFDFDRVSIRSRLVGYQSIHSTRFSIALLHFYNGLLPDMFQ